MSCLTLLSPLPPKLPWRHRLRHRPEPPSRLARLVLQSLPSLTNRSIAISCEQPGQPLPDQLLIDQGIPHPDKGHRPAVAVRRHRLHLYHLGEDEDGGGLLGLRPEILALLRAFDAPQADLLSPAVAEDDVVSNRSRRGFSGGSSQRECAD